MTKPYPISVPVNITSPNKMAQSVRLVMRMTPCLSVGYTLMWSVASRYLFPRTNTMQAAAGLALAVQLMKRSSLITKTPVIT